MRGHREMKIEVSRVARCGPEAVLDLVRDPKTWPRWQPEIVSTEGPAPLDEGDDVYGHASMLGFRVEGHSKSVSVSGDSYEEDVIVGVRMRIVYEVSRDAGRTVVTRRLSAGLPGGVAGRILSLFLRRRLTRMQNGVVEELVRQAEERAKKG